MLADVAKPPSRSTSWLMQGRFPGLRFPKQSRRQTDFLLLHHGAEVSLLDSLRAYLVKRSEEVIATIV